MEEAFRSGPIQILCPKICDMFNNSTVSYIKNGGCHFSALIFMLRPGSNSPMWLCHFHSILQDPSPAVFTHFCPGVMMKAGFRWPHSSHTPWLWTGNSYWHQKWDTRPEWPSLGLRLPVGGEDGKAFGSWQAQCNSSPKWKVQSGRSIHVYEVDGWVWKLLAVKQYHCWKSQ